MRLRTLLAPLVVTTVLVGTIASPAHASVTLSSGHVDVIDVDYNGTNLVVSVLDYTVSPEVERSPSDVILQVPAAAKQTVGTGDKWAFLGTAGATVWILPQSSTAGLLWPGWNTAEVAEGSLFTANTLTFTLKSVTGSGGVPAPGNFSIYSQTLTTPTVLFNSGNGLPDTQSVLANKHKHANWAFTAAGTYIVTFEVTGTLSAGGAKTSGDVAFTFSVLP